MPLSSITALPVDSASLIFDPADVLLTQMPYDLGGTTAKVEIEDQNGNKNALSVALKPVVPFVQNIVGTAAYTAPVRRVGEEFLVKMTGLGSTDSPAPWGDVAASTVRPLAAVEAFVGGRAARVIGAELSRTDVGVWDVRVEVPPIAPDLHSLNLRVGGIDVPFGSISVAP